MAKKKPTPAITYTEILVLAYRSLEREVQGWREALAQAKHATEEDENNVNAICAVQLRKMDAIRTLYRIETGTDIA